MKTYIFHYNVETHLAIPVEAKNVKSAKKKIDKLFNKKAKDILIRDYHDVIDIIECGELIKDEDGNVIEEEETENE